jgi:phospholipid transport system transporter-binding protein
MTRATAQLAERGEGRCTLSGSLTLETTPWLWRELQSGGLLTSATEVDLSGVTESDSTGLALLITWRACRKRSGGDVDFTQMPQRLQLLAALTGAEAALNSSPAADPVSA